MGAGLDELIESLLTEIAFSGVRGCSVSNLLIAIDSFYKPHDESSEDTDVRTAQEIPATCDTGANAQRDRSDHDLAVASKVWGWLAARSDVSIGEDRQFNHMSLEEVLALPEEPDPTSTEAADEASDKPTSKYKPKDSTRDAPRATKASSSSKTRSAPKEATALTTRPRVHVSQERQWRTITGHGPDFKRVPLFEWRALVDIASVKGKGILQGDLVRLTGQDKRSLPTRTDALARKGYIIKQPVVLRGGKSSKLWLTQFMDDAKEDQESEGLDYETVDLSKLALTSDLQPVPFCDKWNRDHIDYLALAQAFVAIVKAWELIRYCDARAKLGVEERVRQMRALAKTCRWLTNIGALSFVGAKFAGSNRLFKDCVKYIRDPAPSEWAHFRATPKTRMTIPSGRIGKRGEASRATHATQPGTPRVKSSNNKKETKNTKARERSTTYTNIIPPPWKPQKPVPNTAFEVIKRAGSMGTSNAVVCRQTLGHNFRRLAAAMTGSISMPTNSQPAHLKHLTSISQLSRIGKTMTYTFYAATEMPEGSDQLQKPLAAGKPDEAANPTDAESTMFKDGQDTGFSQPLRTQFSENPQASLTEITRIHQPRRGYIRKMREKRPLPEEQDQEGAEVKTPKRRGRPPKKKTAERHGSEPDDGHMRLDLQETSPNHIPDPPCDEQTTREASTELARPPGVYRGLPHSINSGMKRRGRKPKSLVLIFRSDRLKDPSFLGIAQAVTECPSPVSFNGEVSRETSVPQTSLIDTSRLPETSTTTEAGNSVAPSKAPQPKKIGWFECDKCGNSWKNSNGLEYHLTKSRSTCNPDFVPPPMELTLQRKRKTRQPQVLERLPGPDLPSEERQPPRSTLTPREQMESRFDTKKRPKKHFQNVAASSDAGAGLAIPQTPQTGAASLPRSARGSIVLNDLEVYDVAEHRRLIDQKLLHAGGSTSTSKKRRSTHDVDSRNHDHSTSVTPLSRKRTKPENTDVSLSNSPSGKSSSARKPLPNIPAKMSKGPDPMDMVQHHGSHMSSLDGVGQESAYISLASFARPTRANATFGARRRERILQIVEYLLYRNDGVFPGLRSLYMAIVSVWAKEFTDLAPPDRRVCQNTINQMERDGLIKQMHFFFFDDQSKMQECVVIAKADTRNGAGVESSDDPRVIAVKEKMREMFPEAYVPDAFSLSPDEAKLFDELALQGKENNQVRSLRAPKDLKLVQNIETLQYRNSVMGDILVNKSHAKRLADEMQTDAQSPLKKVRVYSELPPGTLEKSRKHRRRPEKHEMWDSGKLAVYIWSQRQKASAMWEQHHCCLQDFNTGAWSWTPDTDNAQTESIASILSSVKSAKYFDASLKRKGHRRESMFNIGARGDRMEVDDGNPYDDYHVSTVRRRALVTDGDEISSSDEDIPMTDEDGLGEPGRAPRRDLRNPIFIASSPASFGTTGTVSDDEDGQDGEFDRLVNARGDISNTSGASHGGFALTQVIGSKADGIWPKLPLSFFEANEEKSFTLVGSMPTPVWFLKDNLPNGVQDVLKSARGTAPSTGWADPQYGEFLAKLRTIKRWERSADGAQILTQGTIAPDYIFMSLTLEESRANMKPLNLEWLAANQYTADNVPDEVREASAEDERFGLSYVMPKGKRRQRTMKIPSRHKRLWTRSGYPDTFSLPDSADHHPDSDMPDGFIEYKTRDLTVIPRQPRGRFNKPAAHDDKLGSKREDELVAACVVFRTLLGGLDRNLDLGLLLKHFPGMSLSALKKFWPRVSRERKSYVQALTAKFQSEFLLAYENGELPPLNYDDLENYDWPRLILWATNLETHEDVNLPESRAALDQKYIVEDIGNEVTDWRETWFAITSTYSRIEAIASEAMAIPLPPKDRTDRTIHERARTWVRSICCTPLRGVNVKEKLVPKLLELGKGDVSETNRILENVVVELNREKIITRTKGKDLGGNFRIHGMFSKQLEKMASTPKFRQAVSFKAQLDGFFRQADEHFMPYAADDGAIMAVLNLQAHGRVLMETVDMPNIPFGFEPGNYEGRTFPKSYYHFKVRLTPTSSYLYNDDMALLKQAEALEPPKEGPGGKIPIWVDFFGKVDAARWTDYVSMVVFTLALKGPLVPSMCATLLKPMIDEFEVQLIMDWLDKLGVLQRAVDGCGVTTAEWWWLVVGHIVQLNDNTVGKSKTVQIGA